MDLLNKEAKEFVLHNCYRDVYWQGQFESEVSPHAFESYLKYPFFSSVGIENLKWRLLNETPINSNCFKVVDSEKIKDLYPKNVGFRRQKHSMKGLFFEVSSQNYLIDVSADIITSLKSILNKISSSKLNKHKYKECINTLQLQESEEDINRELERLKICPKLIQPVKKFCCVVGTIGNMMPISEGSQAGGNYDAYRYKLNSFYTVITENYKKNKANYWRYKFLVELCGYKGNIGFVNFVKDFYLQDFFDDEVTDFKNDDKKYPTIRFPKTIESIELWKIWLEDTTKKIIKRGIRIYSGSVPKSDIVDKYFKNLFEWTKDVNNNNS